MSSGDVYKCGVTSWLNSQLGLVLRYYRVISVGGFGILDSVLAEGIFGYLGPLFADCQSADAEVLGVAVRNLSVTPPLAFAISSGAALPGTVTGNELPTQTCGIVTLGTGLAGRVNRGRSYIPFPAVADQDTDGRPDTSYMTALTTLSAALISPITVTSGGNSVDIEPVLRRGDGTVIPLTTAIARRAWGTQRSRGVYGATNPRAIAGV